MTQNGQIPIKNKYEYFLGFGTVDLLDMKVYWGENESYGDLIVILGKLLKIHLRKILEVVFILYLFLLNRPLWWFIQFTVRASSQLFLRNQKKFKTIVFIPNESLFYKEEILSGLFFFSDYSIFKTKIKYFLAKHTL